MLPQVQSTEASIENITNGTLFELTSVQVQQLPALPVFEVFFRFNLIASRNLTYFAYVYERDSCAETVHQKRPVADPKVLFSVSALFFPFLSL